MRLSMMNDKHVRSQKASTRRAVVVVAALLPHHGLLQSVTMKTFADVGIMFILKSLGRVLLSTSLNHLQ